VEPEHSRVIRLASTLGQVEETEAWRRLSNSAVHIGFNPRLPGHEETVRIVLNLVRRLPWTVYLQRSGLSEIQAGALLTLAGAIDPERPIKWRDSAVDGAQALYVTGEPVDSGLRIVPDNFGAHVARDTSRRITQVQTPSALSLGWAAARGVTELFADVMLIPDDYRSDLGYETWCPVSLSPDLSAAAGSPQIILDGALLGCGAIGTGVGLLLRESGASGRILLADRQHFAIENRGTYSLGDQRDVLAARPKEEVVQDALHGMKVTLYHGDIEQLPGLVDADSLDWPRTVLCGLDTGESRRQAQRLWPDRLIDGQTGGYSVGMVDIVGGDGPCMACFFPPGPPAADITIGRLTKLTRLPSERILAADIPLQPNELAHLTAAEFEEVEALIGLPPCAWLQALGWGEATYLPAGPFVSLQAACLIVGRLQAISLGFEGLPNFVEYDALRGPLAAIVESRLPTAGCQCQARSHVTAKVRLRRAQKASSRLDPASGSIAATWAG
jgi:hypothetical protein